MCKMICYISDILQRKDTSKFHNQITMLTPNLATDNTLRILYLLLSVKKTLLI